MVPYGRTNWMCIQSYPSSRPRENAPSPSTMDQNASYSGPEKAASGARMYMALRKGSRSTAIPHACRDGLPAPLTGRLLKQPP